MGGNNHFFPFEAHREDLAVIRGVNFTPREIDIISCLINARGTSKISSLLSISPRTVFTHARNIMLKLECSSREGIIDFIEHARVSSLLKQHYANLVTYEAFEKCLLAISKIKGNTPHLRLIVYGENQAYENVLIAHLENHLKQAGIDIEVNNNINSKLESLNNNKSLSNHNLLILFLGQEDQEKIPEELNDCDVINIFEQRNYYFLVFEILKKLLQGSHFTKHLQKFIEQYEGRELSIPFQGHNMLRFRRRGIFDQDMQFLKNKKMLCVFAIFCIVAISYLFHIVIGNKMPFSQGQTDLKIILIRSDLPIPIPSVRLDRPEEISQIDVKFKENKREHGIQTVALIGPGGIGKTILSRQYAHQQKANVIWEINAETQESLRSSFEDLAERLTTTEKDQKILIGFQAIKDPKEREKKLIQYVKRHLKEKQLNAPSSWFLIYDNVETFQDIQRYFPQDVETWGEGKVIITTRNGNIQNNKYVNSTIQVKELTFPQKLTLFMKIATNGDPGLGIREQIEETKNFLRNIPSFPLDVSIAAYYLRTTNISYELYLKRINKNTEIFTNIQERILGETGDYLKTRYGIITLSVQHILESHKDFGNLLLFVSLLDSQHIPRSLLDRYQKDEDLVDIFLFDLKKHSLAINDWGPSLPKNLTFSMHRNTQEICLAYLKKTLGLKENKQPLHRMSKDLEDHIAAFIEKEDLVKLRLLLNHCNKFLTHEALLTKDVKDSLKNELGGIYLYLGNYLEAKKLLEENLLVRNQQSRNNLNTARALAYLGNVYNDLGNYEKATHVLEEGLCIYKNYFPNNYIGIARLLALLGNVHRDLGNYEKAKNLLEQSVSIYESHSSEHHIGKAWASACLGIIYTILGKYDEAKTLLEQGLVIYQKDPVRNGMGIAWVLAHLGDLHGQHGEYDKAKDLFEHSIALYKEHFPEGHIKTGWALSTLGEVYRALKEYDKAKDVLEQSLIIYRKHLAENHVVTAGILVYLGAVYKDLGEHKKAKDHLERSLAIYTKHFPKEHNETAWALAHLGDIHRTMGQYEEAQVLLEKSLLMYKKFFSDDHVEVTWATNCLKKVCQELGEQREGSRQRDCKKRAPVVK